MVPSASYADVDRSRTACSSGEWVEGGAGAYGVVNPATEEVIDEAPEASAADAEAAAAGGARSAARLEAHDARGAGQPAREAGGRGAAARPGPVAADHGRDRRDAQGRLGAAGAPGRRPLRALREGRAPGHQRPAPAVDHADDAARGRWCHRRAGGPPAGRCRRVHLALQLPAREHGREGRPGARHRQHHRDEARAPGPAGDHRVRGHLRRGRLSARRRQRRHRLGARGGGGARRVAQRRHDQLHRLDGRRVRASSRPAARR